MKKGDDPAKGMACHFMLISNIKRVILAVSTPSILSYFLWSCLLYICCGAIIVWGRSSSEDFFCRVAPQEDQGGVGCKNCPGSLMCSKNLCYRSAMNITLMEDALSTAGSLNQAFKEASLNTACNDLVVNADSPVRMVLALATAAGSMDACKKFHCAVLKNALGEKSDLFSPSGTCTDTYGTKSDGNSSSCVCLGLITGELKATDVAAIESVCGSFLAPLCRRGGIYPSWCAPTTATTTASTTRAANSSGGGAVARRLDEQWAVLQPAVLAHATPGADCAGAASLAQAGSHGLCDDARNGNGQTQVHQAFASSEPRLLQGASSATTAAPAVDTNGNQEWTVAEWSPCTCYQQCVPGVKTRLVQCLAASCKGAKPAPSQECSCPHCAVCDVYMLFLVLMACFFAQSALSLIIFLCYVFMTRLDEENLIKLGIGKRLVGFFSKHLPPLVRFIMLATYVQIVILLVETFAPEILNQSFMKDCFASSAMRVSSLVLASLWLAQLLLGRCAKRFTRKPPWLYVPERLSWPTPIKQIGKLVRSLGP